MILFEFWVFNLLSFIASFTFSSPDSKSGLFLNGIQIVSLICVDISQFAMSSSRFLSHLALS